MILPFATSAAAVWSAIGSATASLTLNNAGNATTFNQTSAVTWLWANTTAATSGAAQSSPVIKLAGTYWTGSVSAVDSWTIQDVVGSGTNGTSTLTFTHSGTTGTTTISVPGTVTSLNTSTSVPSFDCDGSGGVGRNGTGTQGILFFTGNNASFAYACLSQIPQFSLGSGTVLGWNSSAAATGSAADTGFSRVSAAVVALGSGTAGNASGQILANGGHGVSLVSTAAITGAVPVKADTSNANQVVVTTTTDTGAGIVIGVCTNSPGAAGNAQVIDSGIVAMTLGTGTAAIGNFVIVDTTTNGRVKCTGTYTAGTVIGVAMSAQSTVGSTFNVKVGLI